MINVAMVANLPIFCPITDTVKSPDIPIINVIKKILANIAKLKA
jgi:hypothetical protein